MRCGVCGRPIRVGQCAAMLSETDVSKARKLARLSILEDLHTLEKIRLVIWDLDDTFWDGTISEGEVCVSQKNIEILQTLVNRGIMNSICSKNDFSQVEEFLQNLGLWDLFVFPKISWAAKGPNIREIIEQSRLRPETVLFIDDNPLNLQEAKHFVPKLQTAFPEILSDILDNPLFIGKDDTRHTRLKQFKLLEAKEQDRQNYASNTEFLFSSGIHAEIHTNCMPEADRLYELLERTNQLNFTKKRISKEKFTALLQNPDYQCGYVRASDNYGDYGIIGFYALKGDKAEHFLFSCRTLGLGIEQWTYMQVHMPQIEISGKTVVELQKNYTPEWVNFSSASLKSEPEKTVQKTKLKCLIIGGCDLEQVSYYIDALGMNLTCEFNYNFERFIVHREHSEILRGMIEYTEEEKEFLLRTVPFYDEKVFDSTVFSGDYDVVIYSPLIDTALGIYTYNKNPNITAVYGNYQRPLTNNSFHGAAQFLKDFTFSGVLSDSAFKKNLALLREHLPSTTTLLVLNASEQNVKHPEEPNRYLEHQAKNQILRSFCAAYENTYLIDVNQFVHNPSDHTDTIRHYNREIYFQLAQEILKYINAISGENLVLKEYKGKKDYLLCVKKFLREAGLYTIAYKLYRKVRKMS